MIGEEYVAHIGEIRNTYTISIRRLERWEQYIEKDLK
jgi:hypothetical protein